MMDPRCRWERDYGVCSRCNGYGVRGDEYYTETCRHCDGTGVVPRMRDEWRPHEPCKPDLLDEMLASLESKPDAVPEVELSQEMVDALLAEEP